jgi:phospho-N-acetylmuramoyl-pentapeptide-transferase
VTSILISSAIALVLALFGTPAAIRWFRQRGFGQQIREDGPKAHFVKKGTPTMGGIVIVLSAVLAYAASHIRLALQCDEATGVIRCYAESFTPSGLLVIGTVVAMAVLGFLDDFLKISKRRSLGLNKTSKLLGQLVVAAVFTVVARELTQASTEVSFARPLGIDLAAVFGIWVFFILASSSNAVNLADGLDGLASGSGALVMGAYVVISFWQFRHPCGPGLPSGCYEAPHSLDLALVSAAILGAAAGFLWWNAAPAKIFMGDTGSLALGGAMGSLAILTNTQLLLIVLGGLYVIETTSVILQVASFRLFGRRIFKMAPLHHHFELAGWPEFTVIVRFWILAGLAVGLGLGFFYADFIAQGGIG